MGDELVILHGDARSEIQLRDVRSVLRACPDLDWDYLTRWASALGVSALLDEVRA